MSPNDSRLSERLGRLRIIDVFASGMFFTWGIEDLMRSGPTRWLGYVMIACGVVPLLGVALRSPPKWIFNGRGYTEDWGFLRPVSPRNVWIVAAAIFGIAGLFMLLEHAVVSNICFALCAVSTFLAIWARRRQVNRTV
jgi:hypothetical protein